MGLKIDLILRIIAWGLIAFGVLIIFLKWIGVVKSPSPLSLETLVAAGVLIEIGRLEARTSNIDELKTRFASLENKIDMIWNDFKRRKKI